MFTPYPGLEIDPVKSVLPPPAACSARQQQVLNEWENVSKSDGAEWWPAAQRPPRYVESPFGIPATQVLGKFWKAATDPLGHAFRSATQEEEDAALELAEIVESVSVGGTAIGRERVREVGGAMIMSEVISYEINRLAGTPDEDNHARPFRVRRTMHQPRTPIKVGFVLDGTASMSSQLLLGGSCAWAVQTAVANVNGSSATSLMTCGAWPVHGPGDGPQPGPLVLPATGGAHPLGRAISQVNAALNLSGGDGARVLVLFTDYYVDDPEAVSEMLAALASRGVHIISVMPNTGSQGMVVLPTHHHTGVSLYNNRYKPTGTYRDLVRRIGEAIVSSVEEARSLGDEGEGF